MKIKNLAYANNQIVAYEENKGNNNTHIQKVEYEQLELFPYTRDREGG